MRPSIRTVTCSSLAGAFLALLPRPGLAEETLVLKKHVDCLVTHADNYLAVPALALRASEPIAQAPDLRVLLDAMLADQLIRRNLDLSAALASHIDNFAPAEIIECRICAIDEAAAHHSPGVE